MAKGEDYRIANDLPGAIERGFSDILKLEGDIAALMAQHIKPLVAMRNKAWRRLKAESDIGRHVLSKWYGLYKLEHEADEFEDPHEAERLQAELKRAYEALRDGEILDFIALLEAAEGKESKPKKEPAPAAETSTGNASPPDRAPKAAKAPVIKKEDDWDAPPDAKDPAQQEEAGQAGYAYESGYKAGLSGNDLKEELKRLGWHHASIKAKNFRAGHEAGNKKREADLYLAAQAKLAGAPAAEPEKQIEEPVAGSPPDAAEEAEEEPPFETEGDSGSECAAEAATIGEVEEVQTAAQVLSFRLGERRA